MSLQKTQHETFALFFEKPVRESLRELVKTNIGETDYLDFKEDWPADTKLAKGVLALSNSGGGVIVIGMKEEDDGTLSTKGLNELRDKEKISKSLSKYLPKSVSWDSINFHYEEAEYPVLKGKKFQVLLVEYKPKKVPFLSKKAGEYVKDNTIYIRRGTSSTEADHDEVQELIAVRLKSAPAVGLRLSMDDHMQQLKDLYKHKEVDNPLFRNTSQIQKIISGDKYKEYNEFIDDLISMKKDVIVKLIQ